MTNLNAENNDLTIEINKNIRYVVVREGFRVSDQEYLDKKDPVALNEIKFWKQISKKHSHGEAVGIVEYDSKKHRVW